MSSDDYVELYCVKEGPKLRVKISTNGYFKEANVQFPRDLRIEGRRFRVEKQYVTLITMRGKYYYSIKKRDCITILDDLNTSTAITVYEDNESSDCVVCLSNEKDTVFVPCGHYYCCLECSTRLKDCPICRTRILQKINKSLMDN